MSKKRRAEFVDEKTLLPYLRQSMARPNETRETSLSIEAQHAQIKMWGERNGYAVESPVIDHDERGADPDRPGLQELKARLRPGATVAVYMWDRFARGLELQERVVRELGDLGARVISISEPSDTLGRQIYGSFSQYYKEQQSARIRSVILTRAGRGEHHGQAPYGYQRPLAVPFTDKRGQPRVRQSGPVTVNPETAPIVRELFDRVLAGETLLSIAYELERRGVPTEKGSPWNSTCLSRMVRNPAYAGAVRMYGEVLTWEGGHEPIVSRETWDAAQAILARRVVVKQTRQITSWAEGLVEHACGRRMYLYLIRNRPTAPTPVTASFGCQAAFSGSTARCGLPRRHLVAWKLEPAIRECLAADLAALLSMEDATARAHAVAGGDEAAKARKALAARERLAEHRHARARERWLAGREPLAWMDEEDARLDAELAAIATERAALPAEPDANRFAATAARLGQAREAMAFASDDELRDVLEPLGRAVVGESGVRIRWFEPFAAFVAEPHVAIVPHWR